MANSTDFSAVLAAIMSVPEQYKAASGHQMSEVLTSKDARQTLEGSSPDELLSCAQTELDARDHQIGFLCVLESVASRKKVRDGPWSPLAAELARLASGFLAAARPSDYMGTCPVWSKKLCSLCVSLARQAIAAANAVQSPRVDEAKASILPLCSGLECLTQGDVQRITPLHAVLIELCVVTKCYAKAVGLMGPMPSLYEPERFGTKLKDVLACFLHCGDALLSLKRYEEGLNMLKGALSMPLYASHPLATAAAKKYVLGSLIKWGELDDLPMYVSNVVRKTVSQEIPEYQGLVRQAETLRFDLTTPSAADSGVHPSAHALHEYIVEKEATWKEDGNEALIAIIAADLYHTATLIRFLKTYTTMPKDVLMRALGVASAAELDAVVMKFSALESVTGAVRIDDEENVVHFDIALDEVNGMTMRKLMQLIQKATAAKKAVDEDWVAIETSDVFRKQMNRSDGGRGERMKKGMMAREGPSIDMSALPMSASERMMSG